MARPRRPFQGTTVPITRSLEEIEVALERAGATRVVRDADATTGHYRITTALRGLPIRVGVEVPTNDPAEARRKLRVLLHVVKSKCMELTELDLEDGLKPRNVARVFLHHLVAPGGRTVEEAIVPEFEKLAAGNAAEVSFAGALGWSS